MENSRAISPQSANLFLIFAGLMTVSLFGAILSGQWAFLVVPPLLLMGFITIMDFRLVFFILLAFIPLSHETYFSNGLATDLPTEPLIVSLMMVWLVFALSDLSRFDSRFITHPIILILGLHLGWMLITVVNSQILVVSLKFLLAKLWYVVVFVFMMGWLLRSEYSFRPMFWTLMIPFFFAVLWCLYQHGQSGFAFYEVHFAMKPFFRNHVNYAAMLSLFIPFIVLAISWYKIGFKKVFLIGALLVFLIAVYFSYTRAAYVSLILGFFFYHIVKLRLVRLASATALIGLIGLVGYLLVNNNYLEYAPDYNKAISHYEFDELLEATYQFEDISTMERAYRWVAAGFMSKEKPLVGYGPGNFYNFYKGYTISPFRTYVSDNEDRSGIHNYYLMTLVDQGFPGLIILLILVFGALIYGEKIYHETLLPERRALIITVLVSLVIINAFQLINDLLETDKVGAFFFMNMAILVKMDLLNRDEQLEIEEKAVLE